MYSKTQTLIDKNIQAGVFPGVVYGFIEAGQQEILAKGAAQIEPVHQQMKADLLFDVASLTKVVCTTTVLLRLWEAGKITWDQPLHELLPAFQNQTITLRHLLTHTSDIQTYIPNRAALTANQLRRAYLTLQPGENLGKVVKYTDAGTILLGFLIEELYQKDVIEVFQTEVLDPLEMQSSCFLPEEKTKIVPTERQKDGHILKGVTHDPKARTLARHAGNAGLFTNITDLIKFVQMYLAYGQVKGKPYLKKATITSLLQDQTPTGNGRRSLGWDLKTNGVQSCLFHTGYTGTFLLLDPVNQSAFIFLSNRVHPIDNNPVYLKKRDQIVAQYFNERIVS